MTPQELALWTSGAYLLGSIPFGLLIGKLKGVDIRELGSKNIGATNVARTLGKGLGALVLLLDAAKGAVPLALLPLTGSAPPGATALLLLGLAPIVGHCFPIWLKGRGGKGVATALGVFLVVAPAALLVAFALWLGLYGLTRVVSIGSLAAALAFPVAAYLLDHTLEVVWLSAAVAVVIALRHTPNIKRLLRREELKV